LTFTASAFLAAELVGSTGQASDAWSSTLTAPSESSTAIGTKQYLSLTRLACPSRILGLRVRQLEGIEQVKTRALMAFLLLAVCIAAAWFFVSRAVADRRVVLNTGRSAGAEQRPDPAALPGHPITCDPEFSAWLTNQLDVVTTPPGGGKQPPPDLVEAARKLAAPLAMAFATTCTAPLTEALEVTRVGNREAVEWWIGSVKKQSRTFQWRKVAAGKCVVEVFDVADLAGVHRAIPPSLLAKLDTGSMTSRPLYAARITLPIVAADGSSQPHAIYLLQRHGEDPEILLSMSGGRRAEMAMPLPPR